MKIRAYYFKICLKAFKKYIKRKREKKRIGAYTRNTVHRKRMKTMFKAM